MFGITLLFGCVKKSGEVEGVQEVRQERATTHISAGPAGEGRTALAQVV